MGRPGVAVLLAIACGRAAVCFGAPEARRAGMRTAEDFAAMYKNKTLVDKMKADIDLNMCGAAASKYCKGVKAGDGRKAFCLREQAAAAEERGEKPLGKDCRNELRGFFLYAARAGVLTEPVPGLRAACAEDAGKLCKYSTTETRSLVKCLKEQNKLPVPFPVPQPLSERCKERLEELEVEEARDIRLDQGIATACSKDLKTLPACKNLPSPAPFGARKACLQTSRAGLSFLCGMQLFLREQDDFRDVRLNQVLFQACKGEIQKRCGGVQAGEARVLKCLWEAPLSNTRCKVKVAELTRRKSADYRLDWRIRTRCKAEIAKHCGEEQKRVDKLNGTELFEGDWKKGRSGEVLNCLERKHTIMTGQCLQEVQGLAKMHSLHPMSNPQLREKCGKFISQLCSKSAPELVQVCLRRNMDLLDEPCRKVQLTQGSILASSIELKPFLRRACQQATSWFCEGLPAGDEVVIQCLQDNKDDPGFPHRCREAVVEDLEASNHDWRLKYGIHTTCQADADKLCFNEVQVAGGTVLTCLVKNRAKIANQACKSEMRRYMKEGASNINFLPAMRAACVEDVKKWCSTVEPGQGRVHRCLVNHKAKLTKPCARAEFMVQRIQAEDLRLDPQAKLACKRESKSLCSSVPPGEGRHWKCLGEKLDAEEMSEDCRVVITAHERLQNYALHLNPALDKHCSKEAARLCPSESAIADLRQFGSEGSVIACLIRKRQQVNVKACKDQLHPFLAMRLQSIQNDHQAMAACKTDIVRFCGPEEESHVRGAVQKCLQQKIAKLSLSCRAVEIEYIRMQMEDPKLALGKECTPARQRYCGKVTSGVIVCMLEHMHRDGMEADCRKSLVQLQQKRAMDLSFNPVLAQECKDDLVAIQAKHKQDRYCGFRASQPTALNADLINCLAIHFEEAKKPGCQKALRSVLRMQSNDVRAKPGMEPMCAEDIRNLCKDVVPGQGRMHACLRKHKDSIRQPLCRVMVEDVFQAEKKEETLNPMLFLACENEIHTFCPNVKHGQGRILMCLALHRKREGFSVDCQKEVKRFGGDAKLKAAKAEDVDEIDQALNKRERFLEKWGRLTLASSVALIAVSVGLAVVGLRLSKNRPDYGIEVAQQEEPVKCPRPEAVGKLWQEVRQSSKESVCSRAGSKESAFGGRDTTNSLDGLMK